MDSDTNTGYYSRGATVVTSTLGIVDNMLRGYHIRAFSSNWDSNLKIKGAVVTYTITEAE